ncbi:MAG: hypothetical protein PGN11_14845 [Quadrisphaera sp.]
MRSKNVDQDGASVMTALVWKARSSDHSSGAAKTRTASTPASP